MSLKSEYVSGMTYDGCSIRKRKYIIKSDCKNNGKVFYGEVHTKKLNDFEWGDSERLYYKSNKRTDRVYKTPSELINNEFKD